MTEEEGGARLEDAPCGIFCARDDGRLIRVNEFLARLLGSRSSALEGSFLDRAFTAPSRIVFHAHVVPALISHGAVDAVELALQAPGEREVEVLLNAQRRAEEGEPVVCGVLFPLHGQRELQSQLLNAKRLIESLPGMVFQLVLRSDGSSAIPYASDAIEDLHGHSAESVRSDARPFWKSLHPGDVDAVRASLSEAARALTPWHARFRTRPRDETRHVDARAAPQLLRDGSVVFCGYSHDVTEQVRVDELTREKLVAERASEAKTRFLARVNHEMRNPLTAILGFTGLLQRYSGGLNEKAEGMLRSLESAANSLLELVDELLQISRIEAGAEELHLEPVEVRDVISTSLDLVGPLAHGRNITFHTDVPSGLRAVADSRRLQQVMVNLASNAIKYNRPNGRVWLRAERQAGRVYLSVRDEGRGISTEELPGLFQPFNRLGMDRSVAGTGLGLVIALTFVEHMGGTIRVSSTPGEGACFTVDLPAHRVAQSASNTSVLAK